MDIVPTNLALIFLAYLSNRFLITVMPTDLMGMCIFLSTNFLRMVDYLDGN